MRSGEIGLTVGTGLSTLGCLLASVSPLRAQGVPNLPAQNPPGAATASALNMRAWGNNSTGQIGDGSDTGRLQPVSIHLPADVRAIAAGWRHSLALTRDGSVWAWGYNADCQTGKKDALYLTLPAKVRGLTAIRAVAAGKSHSLALRNDGTVWAWGYNAFGQLGDGTITSHFASGRPGGGPDGKPEPARVKELSDVTAIAAGGSHSLALKADGTVWAWGRNVFGVLGTGVRNVPRPLPKPGKQPIVVSFLKRARSEQPPDFVATPIRVEGLTEVAAITASDDTNFAIKKDGSLWVWGVTSREARSDGTLASVDTPIQIKELSHVIAVAPGESHTLALTADGTVWTWGSNVWGELGDGTLEKHALPRPISDLNNVVAIAGGYGHSVALRSDGTVWTWGYNAFGELGDGTHINRVSPMAAKDITYAVAISAGEGHCLALVRRSADNAPSASPRNANKSLAKDYIQPNGEVAYKTFYEVDPFHWSNRAVQELRGNGVIPLYEDRYYNLIRREQYALNIQRGIDYSLLGKPDATGRLFPAIDANMMGAYTRGGRKTLWPEEARLLLRLLREYRSDVDALWQKSGRDLSELAEVETRLGQMGKDVPLLETPVESLSLTNVSIDSVYDTLVHAYHLPLSFIQAKQDLRVSIHVNRGTVQDILDQITTQQPTYQFRLLHKRPILMAREARFEVLITEPTFADLPRFDAKDRFIDYLQKNVKGFERLYGPTVIMGNANAPIFTEPITLRGKTTVLQRFLQLLGKDPQACFYIHRHLTKNPEDINLFYLNLAPKAVEESFPGARR